MASPRNQTARQTSVEELLRENQVLPRAHERERKEVEDLSSQLTQLNLKKKEMAYKLDESELRADSLERASTARTENETQGIAAALDTDLQVIGKTFREMRDGRTSVAQRFQAMSLELHSQ
ncbi:MAG: hypothetical protein L6R39_003006, partial [Caloplaca ligustica]